MTKISEVTFNELREVFNKAIREAFGAGVKEGREGVTASVDEPETIERGGLTLRKVDRSSKTGDFVLYFGPEFDEDTQVGKFYKVFNTDQYSDDQGTVMGVYEWYHTEPELEIFEVVGPVPPAIKSPNQQRYETIQRARDFVEGECDKKGLVYHNKHMAHCIPEFIVNAKKRTVVVLLRGVNSKKLYTKGIAKCHPNDVFHADIGKLIALYKALDEEIPQEFLDAVQPDEVVVGMVIKYGQREPLKVMESLEKVHSLREHTHLTTARVSRRTQIIDDTNAEYGYGE